MAQHIQLALRTAHFRSRIWIGFLDSGKLLCMVIHPSGQISQVEREGGGWSGRFPNASRNEESEDQNIEENVARNDILLI